ncbi:DUF3892 domain-containing protein [Rossellomorea aquimaris]|uniref:DUF3892 domain-containing protein n=1 Tax=Rossellomorea aquimaris TaxID=189382 RepID=UPI001CD5C009|nr:DUF3892 domain-containing protein [Rossellomorea aquimaris]MCA1054562.1 DUF3892 domain-containing protein [Rossellomorea aquimaris]
MEEITKVQRNYQGDIISFQTSGGRIISYRKAVLEASEGLLEGVDLKENEWGDYEIFSSDLKDEGFNDYPTIF